MHRNDRLYSDIDKVQTREQEHTVGEDIPYILVKDWEILILFLI